MKQAIFIQLIIMLPALINAQNIGIGDLAPSAKLTVKGGETSADGQAAAIKLWNISSSNAWYLRAGAPGTNTPTNGFSIGDNSGYHFVISPGGNTGIGINPATARLHVNGAMKLEGNSLLEFGAGIAGKEMNAGKIGYNGFGSNALEIVGAGTSTTNRAVYFFAEGGTTFTGPINLMGPFRIFGNQGTPGQVLTSNGTSAPTWTNAAFSNNTRFQADFYTNVAGSGNMNIVAFDYNLNPDDIVIGANSITINKTGLYRFNGVISGSSSYISTPPDYAPELESAIVLSGTMTEVLALTAFDHYTRRYTVGNPNYYFQKLFSIDLYILAGTIVRISKNLIWDIPSGGGTPPSGNARVVFFGNLIAE